MSFNITPVASGYQEIHPYSAMNIDSVKINTSLIMIKECCARLSRGEGLAGVDFGHHSCGTLRKDLPLTFAFYL